MDTGPTTTETGARRVRARRWARLRVHLLPQLLLLAIALPQLFGGRFRVDSGLYSGLALGAFREGSWWTLMAGDVPYFRKPPLVFWITGGFFEVFGTDLWVMRLPGLLAAMGCVALTVSLGRRLAGPAVGMLCGLILVTNVDFLRFLKRLVLDYWHVLFILAAVWIVAEAIRRDRGRLVALAGVPIGLALLTKPFTALLTLPILALWLLWIRRGHMADWLGWLGWLAAAAAAAVAVAAPWHLSMWHLHGEAFWREYLGRQVLERGGGEAFAPEPWWWYFLWLLREYWPWLITLVLGGWAWRRRRAFRRDLLLATLCVSWCVPWWILASAFADKRDRYLMHILPMLAMVSAAWLLRHAPAGIRRAARRWPDPVVALACAGAIVLAVLPIQIDRPEEQEWRELYRFVRDHAETPIHMGTLHYRRGGRIYFMTGVWPRSRRDIHGALAPPPSGAYVINERNVEPFAGPDEEIVFEEGNLQVVRVR